MSEKSHTLADDLSASGYEMSDELKEALGAQAPSEERPSGPTAQAFGSISSERDAEPEEDDPTQTEFFRAMNAFRAARNSGDAEAMRTAEEHLRAVVRAELTDSEDCGCE